MFVILPGVTANRERLEALRTNAQSLWGEARIEVPDYLSRRRGIRGVGAWLDRWYSTELEPAGDVFVFAFILGAAALPHAPALLSGTNRLVVLRSRFQEGVPYSLRHRYGYALTALLFGKAVADLGQAAVWPGGFSPPVPTLTLIETRATRVAERLAVEARDNSELGIAGGVEMPIDHDQAYFSTALMRAAVEFLKGNQGPIENGKDLGISQ